MIVVIITPSPPSHPLAEGVCEDCEGTADVARQFRQKLYTHPTPTLVAAPTTTDPTSSLTPALRASVTTATVTPHSWCGRFYSGVYIMKGSSTTLTTTITSLRH